MGAAAGVAGIASLASLGLGAASSISQGSGTQAADNFKADQAERAAQAGRVQADLTDTTMRERLNTTLGNIEAVRAAAGTDPTSPTSFALRDYNETLSDRQRIAQVDTLKDQADADEASAAYLRKAGAFALNQSYLSAGATVAGGVAKGLGGMGGGSGGGGSLGSLGGTGGGLGGLY